MSCHVLNGRTFTPSSGAAGLCHMTANVNTGQASRPASTQMVILSPDVTLGGSYISISDQLKLVVRIFLCALFRHNCIQLDINLGALQWGFFW